MPPGEGEYSSSELQPLEMGAEAGLEMGSRPANGWQRPLAEAIQVHTTVGDSVL